VNLCSNISVAENLLLGREPRKLGCIDWKAMNKRAKAIMRDLDVDIDVTQPLGSFSTAIQQIAAIARALEISSVRILILDEPTSSLDAHESNLIFKVMRKLRGEYTFGMNRIYLMFPELGFETSFFVSINDLVIEQCAVDIQKLSIPKFIAWHAHQWLQPDENMFFLHTSYTGPKFATDITKRLWEGATVTYVALQVAYYLGFSEAILIGVDHSFATQGKPNTTIVSEGDDPNHFNPAYFGKKMFNENKLSLKRISEADLVVGITCHSALDLSLLFLLQYPCMLKSLNQRRKSSQ